MYSNKSNSNSIALAKTTSRKRSYVIGLGLLLALLMLVVSFFVARPVSANAEVTTTPTSVVVGELWNAEEERFNSDNLAILQRYIYGNDRVAPSKIDAMAEEGVERLALNSKTVPAGFYKDTAYPAKESTQDIIVTFCGFEWYLDDLHIHDYSERMGMEYKRTILDLVPVENSTINTIVDMEEFTDTTHILAYYIDYNMGYKASDGVVPLNLTHANNRTFDLSYAVVSQLPTDTAEEIITINSERLVPGLDYQVDTTINDGDNSGVVVDGNGMYSDSIDEEISIVRPSALGVTTSLNSGFYRSGVTSITNGQYYNTLSHVGSCKIYYSSYSSYAVTNTVSRTAAGSTTKNLTAGANGGALMVGAGTMTITILKKSFSGGTANGVWYSGSSGQYYIGTSIWNNYSSVTVSDSYKGSWNPGSARSSSSGNYYATSVGTYTMYLVPTDTSNYSGSIAISWKIYGRPVSKCTINLSATSKTFNGTSQSVSVSSITGSVGGTAYTIPTSKYSVSGTTSATNVGTYTITVTGDGTSITGSGSKSWTIGALSISSCSISLGSRTFTGNSQSTWVSSCTYNGYSVGSTSLSGTTSATNAGTYTATVTGSGNLTGSVSKTWTINKYSGALTISGISSSYDYTGSAIKPTPTVSSALGKTMTSGTHYTVSYSNNINVGTATITVTGAGSYSGSGSKTFSIVQRTLESISLSASSFVYDTTTKSVTATVKSGGVTLTNGTHYSISGTSGTNVGTYTVTATGKSPYKGSVSKTWSITKNTTWVIASLSSTSFTYTGSAHQPTPTVKTSSSGYTISSSNYTVSYTGNVNATDSVHRVTVTGKNNISGTRTYDFTLNKRAISYATISGVANKTYSGAAQTQSPTITYNSMTLVNGTSYSLSYSNNTNVGTATMTVTGKGNYTGTTSKTFTISARAANTCTYTYSSLSFTYNNAYQGPTISTAKYSGNNVSTATISGNSQINAGSYMAIITGSGNLSGTTTVDWTISARNMSNTTIATVAAQTYTGAGISPTPTITDSGISKTLTRIIDYTLSYTNNTAVGTATITATGNGNYTGTKAINFTISALAVGRVTITYSALGFFYTGSAQGPTITSVMYGSNNVTTASLYSNYLKTDAGSYTLTVQGSGNLSGTTTKAWEILPYPISGSGVTFSTISNQKYTTSKITQSITLKYNGMTLTKGTDYSETYTNNENVGTATITFAGSGNYSGSINKTFSITARAISSATFDSITNQTYTTNAIKPTPVLRYSNDSPLVLNTDYKNVSYSNNINVGTATITVTGMGNYTGTHSTTFSIVAKALENSMFSSISNKTYTTANITPSPTLTYNGKTLVSGTDYQSITYSNNLNVGTATVTVTGKGNYKGNASTTFNIVERALTSDMIDAIAAHTYTGRAIRPTPTLRYSNDEPMEAGTDYSTSFNYSNNTNVGTATITVTGKGNYKNSASKTFTINPMNIANCTITLGNESLTYNTETQTTSVTVSIKQADNTYEVIEQTDLIDGESNYSFSGHQRKDRGTNTVTITGSNNLTGTNTAKTFTILGKQIEKSMVVEPISIMVEHDGIIDPDTDATTITPVSKEKFADYLTLNYLKDKPMTLGTDYDFELYNEDTIYDADGFQLDGRKPYAVISAITNGNYWESSFKTITVYFEIYANNIAKYAGAVESIPYSNHVYTAHEIKPTVTCKWDTTTLTIGTDYTVAYSANTNVGEATVTITGKGNYYGVVRLKFNIFAADISYLKHTEMTLSVNEYTYTGKVNNPTPTVTYTHNEHYVHGDSVNCASVACTTTNCNCSSATIVTLTNGTDYTYSITNNVNAGTALVTFTGKGNYTGTNYQIALQDQRGCHGIHGVFPLLAMIIVGREERSLLFTIL